MAKCLLAIGNGGHMTNSPKAPEVLYCCRLTFFVWDANRAKEGQSEARSQEAPGVWLESFDRRPPH